jgi:hypothetical protein
MYSNPTDVRFSLKATELLRSSEMTRCARKRHMHRNKQTKLVSLRSLLSPCNITNNRPIGGDKSALYFGVGVCPNKRLPSVGQR